MLRLSLAALLVFTVAACGDDDDGDSGNSTNPLAGPGGGGNAEAPGRNCQARCDRKLTSCGYSTPQASATCSSICANEPTEGELSCAEQRSCGDLERGDDCGISDSSGGSSGSCPSLMCDCNGQSISGVFTVGGVCQRTCADACASIQAGGGVGGIEGIEGLF